MIVQKIRHLHVVEQTLQFDIPKLHHLHRLQLEPLQSGHLLRGALQHDRLVGEHFPVQRAQQRERSVETHVSVYDLSLFDGERSLFQNGVLHPLQHVHVLKRRVRFQFQIADEQGVQAFLAGDHVFLVVPHEVRFQGEVVDGEFALEICPKKIKKDVDIKVVLIRAQDSKRAPYLTDLMSHDGREMM